MPLPLFEFYENFILSDKDWTFDQHTVRGQQSILLILAHGGQLILESQFLVLQPLVLKDLLSDRPLFSWHERSSCSVGLPSLMSRTCTAIPLPPATSPPSCKWCNEDSRRKSVHSLISHSLPAQYFDKPSVNSCQVPPILAR